MGAGTLGTAVQGPRALFGVVLTGAPPTLTGSANLIVHPFGGGVIGNTTGSGPVIEGSSPSPRAPAASIRVMETSARPHRLEA